jgi:hypothetical protein
MRVSNERSTTPMTRNCNPIVHGALGVARPWLAFAGMANRSGGVRAPVPI